MTASQVPAARHQLLTVYGRKPVLEALQDTSLKAERLHLAVSNRSGGVLAEILALAASRDLEIAEHDRTALARISRNGKQDQGVALDIRCPRFATLTSLTPETVGRGDRFLALDGVTNPQNAGMIARTAAAAGITGVFWPRRGVAALGPLVIKASAGALFKAPIIQCDAIEQAIQHCEPLGIRIAILDGEAPTSLFEHQPEGPTLYVVGSETDGVSPATRAAAHLRLRIPMDNGVESLNVAVAAGIVAYATRPRPN